MLGIKTAALPASLRRTNQRTVISLLFRLGSASRAELAKAAGISQPTAGKITAELLQLGVLRRAGPAEDLAARTETGLQRLGRPGQLLRLDDQRLRFIAIELGVSETSVAALPVAAMLEDRWSHTFSTPKTPEMWLQALKETAADIHGHSLWGVLISVPGVVDEGIGQTVLSPNLHWLESISLPDLVRQIWDLPVLLVQEMRALTLGHLAAEPSAQDYFLVDFGQGVGGAVVIGGRLYSSRLPLSGECGHTPVVGNRRPCGCGAVGCLETLVSEKGLLDSFSASRGGAPVSWSDLVRQVNEHGLEGWLTEGLDATARIIAGALNVMGLPRVVITGLLTELPGAVEYVASRIREGAMWGRFGGVICQPAPRRRAAGLVGVGIDRLVLPVDDTLCLDQHFSPNITAQGRAHKSGTLQLASL
jgi:predicted NBD/HSP70 family sugar kinase